MEKEKKRRGRQKGSTSITTIRDEKITPFIIQKDNYGYTILQEKEDSTPVLVGHYSNFVSCLTKISTEKVHTNKQSYSSIKEYINEWNSIKEELKYLTEL